MSSVPSLVHDLRPSIPHRIPRKPPPAVDISERYPSPDPADPFAPLWVLRKRTTSSLKDSRIHTPLTHVLGLHGSEDTLNDPNERSRSDSGFSSSRTDPHAYNNIQVLPASASEYNITTVSPSSSSCGPHAKPGGRIGHYTPHSRLNTVGTLQAFPRVPTPQPSQAHIDLGSPDSQHIRSSSYNIHSNDHALRSPQFIGEHNVSDGSRSESASGPVLVSSLHVETADAAHSHLQQRPTSPSKHDISAGVSDSPSSAPASHNRLAKFFFPKKINPERNRVTSSPTTNTTGTAVTGRGSRAHGARQVSKSSISAPRPIQSMAIRESKNNPCRPRDSPLMKTTTVEEYPNDVHRSPHVLGPAIGKSISLDAGRLVGESNHRQNLTRWHFAVPSLFSIRKPNAGIEDGAHHQFVREQRYNSDAGAKPLDLKKSRRPVFQSLTTANSKGSKPKLEGDGHHKARNRNRMWSSPSLSPMSPVQPSMRSLSSSSIVDISLSAPSFASNPSVYAKPRPAPHPSGTDANDQPSASPKGDTRHKQDALDCSSEAEDSLAESLSAFPAPPVPSSTPVPIRDTTEWALPTVQQLAHAAYLPVTGEDGSQISFGSLFEKTRTIIVFIRHFWCPLCQDYMSSLKSIVKPEMLSAWPTDDTDDAGDLLKSRLVSFVVIGNGAHGMIHKYKQIFGLPFKVYTDPSQSIYQALGMGRDGHHETHSRHQQKGLSVDFLSSTAACGTNLSPASSCRTGGHVKHGLVRGIAVVMGRAVKVGMPVWEKGGDIDQLGGEFIFGPGLKCAFAHRMQSPRGHAPIEDVLTAAGIDINASFTPRQLNFEHGRPSSELASENIAAPTQSPKLQSTHPKIRRLSVKDALRQFDNGVSTRHAKSLSTGMYFSVISKEDEERWMEEREQKIERLRQRKDVRRRGLVGRPSTAPVPEVLRSANPKQETRQRKTHPMPDESFWEPMSDVEDSGDLGDAEESSDAPASWSASQQAWVTWRKSFKSTAESASLYSLPSAVDAPIRLSIRSAHFLADTDEEVSIVA